jgi:acetyl-CoA acetyltransferase
LNLHSASIGAPTLVWAHDTGADLAKTNVNGGAIAIGHPLGASGARIMTTLVNALEQRCGRYGLQTMCEGGRAGRATGPFYLGLDCAQKRYQFRKSLAIAY